MRMVFRLGLAVVILLLLLLMSVWLVSQFKTLRYPRLTFDPTPQATQLRQGNIEIEASGAYIKDSAAGRLRAYTPSVEISLRNVGREAVQLVMENIHPQARLQASNGRAVIGQVTEVVNGLSRQVTLQNIGSRIKLRWVFPEKSAYRFLVMGDTGGDRELDWGLERAAQLGVDFVINLGDLYYYPTEVGQVHKRFNRSSVPVYASLGNHDFRGPEGNTHDVFTRNIGPLNYQFRVLDQCFINLDTGAAMFPADAGERAAFMSGLLEDKAIAGDACEKIVFTHKPFTDGLAEDTIPSQGHSMDGYQAKWLREKFAELGDITLLAGHIHDDFEFELPGIKTYVTGSGLAVEDLIKGAHAAQYLVGEITAGQPVEYQWVLNKMPMHYHCSKKVWRGVGQERPELLARLRASCEAP